MTKDNSDLICFRPFAFVPLYLHFIKKRVCRDSSAIFFSYKSVAEKKEGELEAQ